MSDTELANKKIKEVLREHNLKIRYDISFPIYRLLPEEVKLALSIIKKHGARIQIVLEQEREKSSAS